MAQALRSTGFSGNIILPKNWTKFQDDLRWIAYPYKKEKRRLQKR